jgi:sugar-specific transcriptional regulator TrmB
MSIAMVGQWKSWYERRWAQIALARRKAKLEREVMELEIQQSNLLEMHKDALALWSNIQEAMKTLPVETQQEVMSLSPYQKLRERVESITKT